MHDCHHQEKLFWATTFLLFPSGFMSFPAKTNQYVNLCMFVAGLIFVY